MGNQSKEDKELISKLCQAIEKRVGRKIITPRDFNYLSDELSKSGVRISGTTLKRIWGYNRDISDNYHPYTYTLVCLTKFLGYRDVEDFCNHYEDVDIQSTEFIGDTIKAIDIMPGSIVELHWAPGRQCNLICLGNCRFKVVHSERGKLMPGDMVSFMSLTQNAPLYFNEVSRPGTDGKFVYTAGQRTGIRYQIKGIVNSDEDSIIT